VNFGPLVSVDWLHAHLDEVTVVDVRWYLQVPGAEDGRSGLAEYEAGHIPGAVHLDIDTDLAAPASRSAGRHPLPTEAAFAAALGRMGIAQGRPVVAYDDSGGAQAARLWYLLHVIGEPVAVLDGGLAAWVAAGGGLSTEVPVPYPVRRSVREWPTTRFVDANGLARAIAGGTATVYDARTADRYSPAGYARAGGGTPTAGGAVDPRPGHVPGALNRPWQDNLGADGRFLPPEQLRALYDTDRPVIAYCGSGVTACHDLLALAVAGFDDTALYPGSWSQWGADLSRPTETA